MLVRSIYLDVLMFGDHDRYVFCLVRAHHSKVPKATVLYLTLPYLGFLGSISTVGPDAGHQPPDYYM